MPANNCLLPQRLLPAAEPDTTENIHINRPLSYSAQTLTDPGCQFPQGFCHQESPLTQRRVGGPCMAVAKCSGWAHGSQCGTLSGLQHPGTTPTRARSDESYGHRFPAQLPHASAENKACPTVLSSQACTVRHVHCFFLTKVNGFSINVSRMSKKKKKKRWVHIALCFCCHAEGFLPNTSQMSPLWELAASDSWPCLLVLLWGTQPGIKWGVKGRPQKPEASQHRQTF